MSTFSCTRRVLDDGLFLFRSLSSPFGPKRSVVPCWFKGHSTLAFAAPRSVSCGSIRSCEGGRAGPAPYLPSLYPSRRYLQTATGDSASYSHLTVGVPKETYPNERRVAVTPQNVALLLKKGFGRVLVQRDAG